MQYEGKEVKAVIFDLDGVLVKSFTTTPLPGAKERIASLKKQGIPVAIATNQAGPIWRWRTGQQKYPDAQRLIQNIVAISGALELEGVPWWISLGELRVRDQIGSDNYYTALQKIKEELLSTLNERIFHVDHVISWRKPEPGMLLAAATHFDIEPEHCLYVGGMDTDRVAAETAGMMFEMVNQEK